MPIRFFIAAGFLLLLAAELPAQDADTAGVNGIPLAQYRERRERVIAEMDSNAIALFAAAIPRQRNGDTEFRYRQEDALLYLTGFPEERSILLLSKTPLRIDGAESHEILFVREKNALFEMWTGAVCGVEEARGRYGIAATRPIRSFRKFIDSLLASTGTLYYSTPLAYVSDPVTGAEYGSDREARRELGRKFPSLRVKNLNNLLARLRGIKSPEELALLEKAIDATVEAQREAMKACAPDKFEYELQAVIEYCFTRAGCEYPGFPSIVGSGPNSTVLHYDANRRRMRAGEVVVMDIGAEYHGYSADVTRTIPVGGSFSPEQREIYAVVLRAQEAAIRLIRPGAKFAEVEQAAVRVINEAGYGAFLPHGVSHGIGLDVHDGGIGAELKPGMVITMEPGIYIPEGASLDKKYWNIGIRIEDDVLVTGDGSRVLSAGAPRTIEEIEAVMAKSGR